MLFIAVQHLEVLVTQADHISKRLKARRRGRREENGASAPEADGQGSAYPAFPAQYSDGLVMLYMILTQSLISEENHVAPTASSF